MKFKLARAVQAVAKTFGLSSVDNRGGWWPFVREPYTGAWQKNDEWRVDTVLAYHAVFSCITLIAADIGKLRLKLVAQDPDGTWNETTSPAFSPVLRKPNRFQNHIQFKEWWVTSKLTHGNAYALKERDNRGVVVALYLLDPCRVRPLVAPDGEVFYSLGEDNLAGIQGHTAPASEIIHDRMNCIFHPLMGVSPLFASGLAALQGLKIQSNSNAFFGNGSKPGGILSAPGAIDEGNAKRLKEYWDTNFTGENAGRVAVVGDGLQYTPLRMSAVDSQMLEQLRWTAEVVCSTFHVPAYMVGVGAAPAYNNIEALSQQYYSQCLQTLIESFELCLDEGLKVPAGMGTELDLDGLLRMDTKTQVETLAAGIGGALMAPNEGRKRINLKPIVGGDTVYMQQQNYSLQALNERDKTNPLAAPPPAPPAPPPAPVAPPAPDPAAQARELLDSIRKGFADAAADA